MFRDFLHLFGIHFWKFHHDTGFNKYYICSVCGKRKVICPAEGYQAIDYKWLGDNYVVVDWNQFNY